MSLLALLSAALLPLTASAPDQPPNQPQCTPDRSLCLSIANGDEDAEVPPQLVVTTQTAGDSAPRSVTLTLPYELGERESLALWPNVIVLPPSTDAPGPGGPPVLIGLLMHHSVMYSGGGGSATRLVLRVLDRGYGSPRLAGEVLNLPWSASLLIRACFSETDMETRAGACHDEYAFSATVDLLAQRRARPGGRSAAPILGGYLPELTYRTVATSYPDYARRDRDSLDHGSLTAANLVHARDPVCSYTRTLRYNPASERYEMDRPAPDCSAYTVP
jgi:hypothetical protein